MHDTEEKVTSGIDLSLIDYVIETTWPWMQTHSQVRGHFAFRDRARKWRGLRHRQRSSNANRMSSRATAFRRRLRWTRNGRSGRLKTYKNNLRTHIHTHTSGPDARIVIHWRSVNASWRWGETVWMSISRPSSSPRARMHLVSSVTRINRLSHSTSASFVHFFPSCSSGFSSFSSQNRAPTNGFGARVVRAHNFSRLVVHSRSEPLFSDVVR